MSSFSIDSVLKDSGSIKPSKEFAEGAHVSSLEQYQRLWQQSIDDPDTFWGDHARQMLTWSTPFTAVRSGEDWAADWFVDGRLNACVNAVDRHLPDRQDKPAIVWEGEPGDQQTWSYGVLHKKVCQLANALRELGVCPQDVVMIYMPMVPELTAAVLACARIGAVHSVVFGGFSSEAIAKRIGDANAKFVLTADGTFRKGSALPLKARVDEAVAMSPSVEHVLVLKRTGQPCEWDEQHDHRWEDVVDRQPAQCEPYQAASEDPLFILYTSGSTGSPKGIVHATAGYLLQAALSFKMVFDIHDDDMFWCTADVGWITGHSYVVYGPLVCGGQILMYEGAPNYPDWGRFWQIIEQHRVTKFYTAPTAIRAFMQQGSDWVERYDLSSLQLLGTVGEPINPRAWRWFYDVVGQGRCPIVDTWWQTETGSIMITTLPGAAATKPGSAGLPLFGVAPEIVDTDGQPVDDNTGGLLVLKRPWPGMFRSIWGDHGRYLKQYFDPIPDRYLAGDGARRDEDGYYWIMGRIDDVINVSGHRLSTMEIESALVSHGAVSEAAVVGAPDDITGEAINCFVVLEQGRQDDTQLQSELSSHVVQQIGALARPARISIAPTLPKTRSGKIMRRLLRDIAAGRQVSGDLTTLDDAASLERLRVET